MGARLLGGVGDLSKGEAGAKVVECGEGAVGGGRWMNVKFSSLSVLTAALELFSNGSGKRAGGFSAIRVA
jgi:hypothetical protein